MAIEVTMPQLGLTMTSGTLLEWVKQAGDTVEKGEIIYVVENDKSTVEVESPAGGVLARKCVAEGEQVPVGEIVAWITAPGEELPEKLPEKLTESSSGEHHPGEKEGSKEGGQEAGAAADSADKGIKVPKSNKGADGFVLASPLARRLAKERGIVLGLLQGSGPDGVIVEQDVLSTEYSSQVQGAAPRAAQHEHISMEGPDREVVKLSRTRTIGGQRMVQSWTSIPQFYLETEIEADSLMRLAGYYKEEKERGAGEKISLNLLLIKIIAHGLAEFPLLNSRFIADGEAEISRSIDMGIAMDTPEGLLVPVLRNVTAKGIFALAAEWSALSGRVKSKSFSADDVSGSTVTISNLGMFGVTGFQAIINPPEAAIISIGAARRQYVPGTAGMRDVSLVRLGLTADHRIVDGAYGARFLARIKQLAEVPAAVFIE